MNVLIILDKGVEIPQQSEYSDKNMKLNTDY